MTDEDASKTLEKEADAKEKSPAKKDEDDTLIADEAPDKEIGDAPDKVIDDAPDKKAAEDVSDDDYDPLMKAMNKDLEEDKDEDVEESKEESKADTQQRLKDFRQFEFTRTTKYSEFY